MEHLKKVTSNKGFEKGSKKFVRYLVLFVNTAARMAPVAESIAEEYAMDVQSAIISVLRNESVASEPDARTSPIGPTSASTVPRTHARSLVRMPSPPQNRRRIRRETAHR